MSQVSIEKCGNSKNLICFDFVEFKQALIINLKIYRKIMRTTFVFCALALMQQAALNGQADAIALDSAVSLSDMTFAQVDAQPIKPYKEREYKAPPKQEKKGPKL